MGREGRRNGAGVLSDLNPRPHHMARIARTLYGELLMELHVS